MARYIDADALVTDLGKLEGEYEYADGDFEKYEFVYGTLTGVRQAITYAKAQPTADVAPRAEVAREIFEEVEKIFDKFKMRQCSNSACAWCVHATVYGRRNEECDKPYIDKNGEEKKACYFYSKFESIIDKELAELKKKCLEANDD